MEFFNLQNWLTIWGGVILIVLPLIFLITTYFYNKRKTLGKTTSALQLTRVLFLPSYAVFLILKRIIYLPKSHSAVKVFESIITIILVGFIIVLVNRLFFSNKSMFWRREVVPKLVQDVLQMALIILASAVVLSEVWGIDLGNLISILGVSSLIIGLALQEPLGNLFNGIFLIMAKPFKKGDWVSLAGITGKVYDMNWHSVKVHTKLNEEIIIPNNRIGKEIIKNYNRPNGINAELLTFRFPYDNHPENVKSILLRTAKSIDKILEHPAPLVYVASNGDSSISYELQIFFRDHEDGYLLKDELIAKLVSIAEENNITFPFPK